MGLGGIMKPGGAILLGMAFAVCLGAPASSATIKSLAGKNRRVVIQISGQIAPGDADIFIGVVRQANDAGKVVESVQLNSSGGILLEGARMAAAIKLGKMSTTVAQDGLCLRLLSGLRRRRSEICR
jgi:membrane-bound ClpP family serine protease